MTKIIIQSKDDWAKNKITSAITAEREILKRVIDRSQDKIQAFESRHGKLDRKALYGKVDDMELLEWEGELEILQRLKGKLKSLEEITFEYQ